MDTRSIPSRLRRWMLMAVLGPAAWRVGAATLTPRDAEGPYYPPQRPTTAGPNLRVLAGRAPAEGQPLDIAGRVLNPQGQPLPGVLIEVWQTDARGNYIHPAAPLQTGTVRDPGFAGYGRVMSDASGRWQIATIRPLGYFGRPPHIHVKLWQGPRELLTTQLYFPGRGGPAALMLALAPTAAGVEQARFDFVVAAEGSLTQQR